MNTPKSDENDNVLIGLFEAPEILVEGYRGAMTRAGLLKLNFFAQQFDPATDRVEKRAAATLVIPLEDFPSIVRGLNELLNDMRDRGALPKEEPS